VFGVQELQRYLWLPNFSPLAESCCALALETVATAKQKKDITGNAFNIGQCLLFQK